MPSVTHEMAPTSPNSPVASSASDTRPRRQSRFTEGCPFTGSDATLHSPQDNSFLLAVLQQQDEIEERRRKARSDSSASADSTKSTDSFSSSFSSTTAGRRVAGYSMFSGEQSPTQQEFVVPDSFKHIGHRSVTFGRQSEEMTRRSLDERPRDIADSMEGLATKVKGRLRALTTGGRDRNVQPYPGT